MSGNAGVGGNGLIVPADFEPTLEEKSLLALYGKVRLYEKERDKIKEQAAKDKLRAKDEQFRRENEGSMNNRAEDDIFPSSNKKKRARSNSGAAGDEMDYDAATGQDSDDDSEVDSGDDRDEENSVDHAEYKARRRQEKLKKLRQSVEEEKERGKVKQKALEEQERQLHLMDGGNVLMDDGLPVLKKKAPQYGSISESLLSSVQAQSTPPHEFSKKLALPRIGHYGMSFSHIFLFTNLYSKIYTSHFFFFCRETNISHL